MLTNRPATGGELQRALEISYGAAGICMNVPVYPSQVLIIQWTVAEQFNHCGLWISQNGGGIRLDLVQAAQPLPVEKHHE